MNRHDPFAPIDPDHGETPPPPSDWQPILPIPDNAPPLTAEFIDRNAPPGYTRTAHWRYLDADGRRLGTVVRFDPTDPAKPKVILPFTYGSLNGAPPEWLCKGWLAPRPLYGLDRLAARPDSTVLVVEGEKAADAAAERFPDLVVIASPNGAKAARKADWLPLKGRKVVIWPDADAEGSAYAADVASVATAASVAGVRVVKLPPGLPEGWDLADPLPDGIKDEDLVALIDTAETVEADGPLPLFPPLPSAEPYPVDALGPVLGKAARAIASKVQVPEAIAGQSVLVAAALAAQAHADVRLPFGQTRPLSLYGTTVAASGERKTTSDNEATWPIRKREQTLREIRDGLMSDHLNALDAYMSERTKVLGDKKLDRAARKAALDALGPKPLPPLHAMLTAPDPTFEGLVKAWVDAPASLGVFAAEGGVFVGGHGMSSENKLRTAAAYSEAWDGKEIRRVRAGDGVVILPGRRLSMHLMIQSDVAHQFLADPVLKDQGLLSRILVVAPDSIAGGRVRREPTEGEESAIRAYGARLLSILEAEWPLRDGRNELEPRVIEFSAEATELWWTFYDHVERQCGPNGALAGVQDFASKVAEHAARIAGVLAIVENVACTSISEEIMAGAITLADFYLAERLRLYGAARTDPRLLRAQELLDWLHARDGDVVSFRDLMKYGPNRFRTKDAAEDALSALAAHGWVAEVSKRPRVIRVIGRSA